VPPETAGEEYPHEYIPEMRRRRVSGDSASRK